MKIGLVGFAGSGKTTVFNTMTGLDVPVGYGGEVRLGTVRVPDDRIDTLSSIFSPKKTTYAEMSFCDVPGEHGAEKKGLSPRGLQQIRDQEALCLVLRDFSNPALAADPDPLGDLEAFHAECVFADLEIVEKRLDRARKERADAREISTFERALEALEAERPLRSVPEAELDRGLLKGFGILSDKPLLRKMAFRLPEMLQPQPAHHGFVLGLDENGAVIHNLQATGPDAFAPITSAEQHGDTLYLGSLTEPRFAGYPLEEAR